MNVLLWIFQIVLALHTLMGAVWKFSNSEQSVPSLSAIPHGMWMSLSVVEILCSVGLVIPALYAPLGILAPIGASVVAAEMLLFCVLHKAAHDPSYGPMVYWLVVAVFSAFVAYGRFVLKPIS